LLSLGLSGLGLVGSNSVVSLQLLGEAFGDGNLGLLGTLGSGSGSLLLGGGSLGRRRFLVLIRHLIKYFFFFFSFFCLDYLPFILFV